MFIFYSVLLFYCSILEPFPVPGEFDPDKIKFAIINGLIIQTIEIATSSFVVLAMTGENHF